MQPIQTIFTNLLNIGVGVGVIVAAFFLMWGAYQYMSAVWREWLSSCGQLSRRSRESSSKSTEWLRSGASST